MINRIIQFSARNAFLVVLLIVAIVGSGYWALRKTPIDAIPDLSDVQVIIMTDWEGRSPTLVEDQVTYPIVTSLISAPRVKVVRGFSYFDVSFVYVIFEDGTDPYWARTRVLEYLSALQGRLPEGVKSQLGPDASGVGWGFEYALTDRTGKHDLAQLRTLNDWYVQYWLRSVPGVAEVAPYGGFVKQYQIEIDPNALAAFNIPLDMVVTAVRKIAFIRGKIPREERNPVNRLLMRAYHPLVRFVLRHRVATLLAAAALLAGTVPVYLKLGSEFMPPLYEGTILYMPTTLPGASIETARQALQLSDKLIMTVPEVASVAGKAGRALSATDPAPPEMFETVINLKPESEWRPGMTQEKLVAELDRVVRVPGLANAWTMPIKARIDMLSTGIRTAVGIKVFGPELAKINDIGAQIEAALDPVQGTRNVFAERVTGGYYLDFKIKRDQIARYNLNVADVEMAIESAIGGANVTTTIEGRERYPVNIRYLRDYRTDVDAIRRTLIATPGGAQIPLEQVADVSASTGPTVLRTEQAQLLGYVYIDVGNRDLGSYVADAKAAVARAVKLPPGYTLEWSGQYRSPPNPLAGVVVSVEGGTATATTDARGQFTLGGVAPGPVFVAAAAPSSAYLPTETRDAVFVGPGSTVGGVKLVLSARPSDTATYVGMDAALGCAMCHTAQAAALRSSAHNRSLTRIQRDGSGKAVAGGFGRMLNARLTVPRVVMQPLAGTITAASTSAVVTGAATAFQSTLLAGDELGYTPIGLGWQKLGIIQSVDNDGQVTLTASATLAPGTTSLTGARYSIKRLSRTYSHMLPEDSNDIVAPAWPGVKATNPNYDPNDPCIYGNAPSGTCAAGGTSRYADGQVNVYICNLKDGVTYLDDEYVQKFGGSPYTCGDGSFYDGITAPPVPLVHIDVIYGGQGDKDGNGVPHKNMGVFKQRFQGRLADIKAADSWTYTAGKNLDSLTLPIQVLESGDKVNGGYKMNGYHPTEQKFPGESWTQRARTFSHACAGCHNDGLQIAWTMQTVSLPFPRDNAASSMTFAAITSYQFKDENLTCEHCHGPGSEHRFAPGKGNAIINPRYLSAEAERQLCGKCHGYDDATNAKPAQDYGFEYPWNSDHANQIGGGDFVPGVYELGSFFDNWGERHSDDEGFWDPTATGGVLFGQAHRQQYTMLAQSKHDNNPYEKLTCTSCHDSHTLYLGSSNVTSSAGAHYALTSADYRNNVMCLGCHAGFGPFVGVSKDDVANVHVASGGTGTKDGAPLAPAPEDVVASRLAIGNAVGTHMLTEARMPVTYNPLDDANPLGRCTTCHMPKVAKSGGYVTGNDASNPPNKALVEGDQASHVFSIVWPWQSGALSRGGPTFQSGYYGQSFGPSNTKYDQFGFMPNSCSKCHASARQASLYCPDTATIWPTYWPYGEHRDDPYWAACFTSTTAP